MSSSFLMLDAADLIKNILQQEPSKRLSIPQILAHPWFTHPQPHNPSTSTMSDNTLISMTPLGMKDEMKDNTLKVYDTPAINDPSPSPATSETSFHSASSELSQSVPTTPDDSITLGQKENSLDLALQHNSSLSTLKERSIKSEDDASTTVGKRSTEDNSLQISLSTPRTLSRDPSPSPHGSQSHPPSSYPTRTPARTKRRSVSSILSQPTSPTADAATTHLAPQNFASLLSTPAPRLFSTPLERDLLNNLNMMGFDIGQMVHSVLSDACDASGAVWWMLKRKAEKKALEEGIKRVATETSLDGDTELEIEAERERTAVNLISESQPQGIMVPCITATRSSPPSSHEEDNDKTPSASRIDTSRSAPELTFVPPTPTLPKVNPKQVDYRPITPPRSKSPRSLLSPTPSVAESTATGTTNGKSTPTTPSGSTKSRDGKDSKVSKPRSGSVSIMQRATTALEAAGLVRKRSAEGVKEREEREREKRASDEKEKEEKEKEKERSRTSSGPSKLQKSPPLKPVKDKEHTPQPPSTPERDGTAMSNLTQASPWVMPSSRSTTYATVTPVNFPVEPITTNGEPTSQGKASANRNRGSILATFRTWFNEDRKGKRKASSSMGTPNIIAPPSPAMRSRNGGFGMAKRGTGWGNQTKGRSGKRASISSRRSSSVNSRRSSIASVQMMVLEAPHHNGAIDHMTNISRQRSDPSRRSFTPNSELDREKENYPSRPSSVHSHSMKTRHRKSPSGGSAGSVARIRNGSPLQKYHRRMGSNSSIRVVRQTRPSNSGSGSGQQKPPHVRSNSTASSIHSRQSSRPGSFYEVSEGENSAVRTGSPLPRRSLDDTPRKTMYSTVLVAQKQRSPFLGPSSSLFSVAHAKSWRKAWGTEPPGWSNRSSQLPVEVLSISPPTDQPTVLRDVFSGRQSVSLGDEDEWVDEDDDIPMFAGGLGQVPTSTAPNKRFEPPPMLSPLPRTTARNTTKKAIRNVAPPHRIASPVTRLTVAARSKPGHSPVVGTMPLPGGDGIFDTHGPNEIADTRISRRQLPTTRSGPAFRQAIQEEDEGEEE